MIHRSNASVLHRPRRGMTCPSRPRRHRAPSAALVLLALLVSAAPSLGRDGGVPGRQQGRLQRRHRDGADDDMGTTTTWARESVSDAPLTFDAPAVPPPIDRQRILASSSSSSSSSPPTIEEDDEYHPDETGMDAYYHDAMGGGMDEYHTGEEEEEEEGGMYYYPGNADPSYVFDEDDKHLLDENYQDDDAYHMGEGMTDDANGALYFDDLSPDYMEDVDFEVEEWDDADVLEGEDEEGYHDDVMARWGEGMGPLTIFDDDGGYNSLPRAG